jgi:predicted DNA-binding WGR domain protein
MVKKISDKTYLEFVGEDVVRGREHSSKFWEVWVEDKVMHVRFGKVGAKGQETIKTFESRDEAEQAMTKSIAEKKRKGYLAAGEAADKFPDACTSCGEERVRETDKFCAFCGARIGA